MSTHATARHRAAARPKTPLSTLAATVSANAGTMGRRSAVIAASSGLVVTMGLPAATAAPLTDGTKPEATPAPAAAPQATEAPAAAPQVTVPADANVSFARTALTSATPPPPPPPPPPAPVAEPRAEREQPSRDREQVSRSSSRKAAPTAEPSKSEAGGSILSIAARYVGTPYVYGGTTPSGFDCSGYTQYVFKQVGISLPRTSGAQSQAGRRVSASEARPGDLVWTSGHIGIYAGGNMMYDAPRTGKSVAKREIWYTPTFIRVTG